MYYTYYYNDIWCACPGLLQLFGDFCPSIHHIPPMQNNKGRLRESMHSRYMWHKGIVVVTLAAAHYYTTAWAGLKMRLCLPPLHD